MDDALLRIKKGHPDIAIIDIWLSGIDGLGILRSAMSYDYAPDKTPSFIVWPGTNTWHCFGCGKGGNAIEYMKLKHNMSYIEAVKALAKDAGITIEERKLTAQEQQEYDLRQKLYDIYEEAAKFYEAPWADGRRKPLPASA